MTAGHVEVLLDNMKSANVDGAFIIQPGNHLYDHSYVSSVLRAHPDKFVGALLANPTTVRTVAALRLYALCTCSYKACSVEASAKHTRADALRTVQAAILTVHASAG